MDKNSVARLSTKETHELRECPGCYEGLIYDTVIGAWVDHDGCNGSGRAGVRLRVPEDPAVRGMLRAYGQSATGRGR